MTALTPTTVACDALLSEFDIDELLDSIRVKPGEFANIPGVSLMLPLEMLTKALAAQKIDLTTLLGRIPCRYPHVHVALTAALANALSTSLFGEVSVGDKNVRNTFYLSLSDNHQLSRCYSRIAGKPAKLAVLTHQQVQTLLQHVGISAKRELDALSV